jgi:hypothetical protein
MGRGSRRILNLHPFQKNKAGWDFWKYPVILSPVMPVSPQVNDGEVFSIFYIEYSF